MAFPGMAGTALSGVARSPTFRNATEAVAPGVTGTDAVQPPHARARAASGGEVKGESIRAWDRLPATRAAKANAQAGATSFPCAPAT